jgi:hypothetical protein
MRTPLIAKLAGILLLASGIQSILVRDANAGSHIEKAASCAAMLLSVSGLAPEFEKRSHLLARAVDSGFPEFLARENAEAGTDIHLLIYRGTRLAFLVRVSKYEDDFQIGLADVWNLKKGKRAWRVIDGYGGEKTWSTIERYVKWIESERTVGRVLVEKKASFCRLPFLAGEPAR